MGRFPVCEPPLRSQGTCTTTVRSILHRPRLQGSNDFFPKRPCQSCQGASTWALLSFMLPSTLVQPDCFRSLQTANETSADLAPWGSAPKSKMNTPRSQTLQRKNGLLSCKRDSKFTAWVSLCSLHSPTTTFTGAAKARNLKWPLPPFHPCKEQRAEAVRLHEILQTQISISKSPLPSVLQLPARINNASGSLVWANT